ncbi:MAG: hypothetical protein V9G19_21165 [Tetrasphaera sp.]
MTSILSAEAPPVLQEYYRVLTGGADRYGDGAVLRPLLSEHLDFTGSLAGHLSDATEGFLHGVAGFIETTQGIAIVRDVHDANGSAVLYDAEMPGGSVRFAEFFTFADGRIASLNLHYDGPDYLAKGGH